MPDDTEGLGWVHEDAALVARLEQHWPGWDAEGAGLAALLEEDPSWQGQESWNDEQRRDQLAASLDQWYPPAAAEAPAGDWQEPAAAADPAALWAAAVEQFGSSWAGWDGTDVTWPQFRDWFYEATNSVGPESYGVAYQHLQPLDELPAAERITALRNLGMDVSGAAAHDAADQAGAIQALAADPAIESLDQAAVDALLADPDYEKRMAEAQAEVGAELEAALAELDELEPS